MVVFSRTGLAADMVAKYRPPCPVLVASDQEHVLRLVAPRFGLYPLLIPSSVVLDKEAAVDTAVQHARCGAVVGCKGGALGAARAGVHARGCRGGGTLPA